MNKKTWIWIALGGVVAYLLLSSKKESSIKVEATKDENPKDIPNDLEKKRYADPLPQEAPVGASKDLIDAMEEAKKMSIGKIMSEYNNLVCKMTAAKIKYTPEEAQKREIKIRALTKVAFDRGVKLDCDINKNPHGRFKFSPVGPLRNPKPKEGVNIPYGSPPIERLQTGIN